MQTRSTQLTDAIYNAANQCFEALVTVHDGRASRKYPCAVKAPISMSFEEASRGLIKQAERQHMRRDGTFSQLRLYAPAQRAGRAGFDPVRFLKGLCNTPEATRHSPLMQRR